MSCGYILVIPNELWIILVGMILQPLNTSANERTVCQWHKVQD